MINMLYSVCNMGIVISILLYTICFFFLGVGVFGRFVGRFGLLFFMLICQFIILVYLLVDLLRGRSYYVTYGVWLCLGLGINYVFFNYFIVLVNMLNVMLYLTFYQPLEIFENNCLYSFMVYFFGDIFISNFNLFDVELLMIVFFIFTFFRRNYCMKIVKFYYNHF